jgi:hypothetical protein
MGADWGSDDERFSKSGQVSRWFDRYGWDLLENVENNRFLHSRRNAAVVEKVRSLVQFMGEERAERDGVDWEDIEFARSWWMNAADRFHEEVPNDFFGWDEEIERQVPPTNPVIEQLDKVIGDLKVLKDNLSDVESLDNLPQKLTEMKRQQVELARVVDKSIADSENGMRRLVRLVGGAIAGIIIILVIQLLSHFLRGMITFGPLGSQRPRRAQKPNESIPMTFCSAAVMKNARFGPGVRQ